MIKKIICASASIILLTACNAQKMEHDEQKLKADRAEMSQDATADFDKLKQEVKRTAKDLEAAKAKHDKQVEKTAQLAYDKAVADFKKSNKDADAFHASAESDWKKAMRKSKSDLRDAIQKIEMAKANHDKEAEKLANEAYAKAQKDFDEALLYRKREQAMLENDWHRNMHKAKSDMQKAAHKLEAAKARHDQQVEKDAQIALDAAHETFEKAMMLSEARYKRVQSDLGLTTKHAESRLHRAEKKLIAARKQQDAEAEKLAQEAYNKAIADLQRVKAKTEQLIQESNARVNSAK